MGAKEYKIATIGSHSALQILKGAKDEGFSTIAICKRGTEKLYKNFGVADKIISVKNFDNFREIEKILKKENAIIIPHGSFIAYMGWQAVERIKTAYFGSKGILKYEADREVQRGWLHKSKLKTPHMFKSPKQIDRSVIVKFYGAAGGRGYFVANSEADFNKKIKEHKKLKYAIQEYIIGVPVYFHYFYSPLTKSLELMSCDIRYESNVDSLGRISARDQIALESVDPSYVVVGNIPVVLRESLLHEVMAMGERVVKQSKKYVPKGLYGPFCLEAVIKPNLDIYVFEISARIVAGTNPYVNGSPYSYLKYDEPMSTGRRIAREIKNAIRLGKLKEVLE